MSYATDLNQRERKRYATSLRAGATTLNELADALEAEDDTKAMVLFVTSTLSTAGPMNELQKIFLDAANVSKEAAEMPDAPDFS